MLDLDREPRDSLQLSSDKAHETRKIRRLLTESDVFDSPWRRYRRLDKDVTYVKAGDGYKRIDTDLFKCTLNKYQEETKTQLSSDQHKSHTSVRFNRLADLCQRPGSSVDRRELRILGDELRLIRVTYNCSRVQLATQLNVEIEKIIATENGYGELEESRRLIICAYSALSDS